MEHHARASGTPFISFFAPRDIVAPARGAGLTGARHVSAATLDQRYFAGGTGGLPTTNGEELLVATV
ncbi:hypothetical protein [Streptomyces sp. NPDC093099]|uniref:hypothetical protein n=1 Tax=Streptomyces sp. NPDC093099 TaxID=3366028 RepID=UPI0038136284